MRLLRPITSALVAAALLGACQGDGPTGPTPRLVAVGRVERGATIRLVAREGAVAADSLVSSVTISPATAGTVSGSTVKLLQPGLATVTARAAGGRSISTELTVALPPTVYFDAVSAGNRDIYGVALDGGELKRWTTAPSDDSRPTVGRGTLLFSSTRHGNDELYSITLASGVEQRLTSTAASERLPALSADGARVAYVGDAGGATRVFVAPATLVGAAPLTVSGGGASGSIESHPGWAPTGDRIVFASTANGRTNLFIASSVAGSIAAAVPGSTPQATDVEPAWSPDGNRIAFVSARAGGAQLFLLDLRTGAITQLTNDAAASGQPGWLSDGRLVYTVFAGGQSTLWWLDPDHPAERGQIPTGTAILPANPTGETVRPTPE